jgi:hypothetical protein
MMNKLSIAVLGFALLASTFAQAQVAKRYITVEHFTNTLCSSCRAGNPQLFTSLENNPGEVHHLSIHSEVPYAACIYYQYNTVGNNTRKNLYGINSTPSSITNGLTRGVGGANLLPQSRIDGLKNASSPLRIQVAENISGGVLNVNVRVKTFAAVSNPNLRMFVAIAEKETIYNAPNGESEHFNVFRTMLPGNAGVPFTPAALGSSTSNNFSIAIDPIWQQGQIYATVFIQDTVTKEIWNSGTKFDLILESNVIGADCAGVSNGAANLIVLGGTAPYTYTWSSGGTSNNVSGLAPGVYVVTVIDANDQQYIDSITIPISSSLVTQLSYTPTVASTGTATVSVSGGATPYTYLWSNGNTMATATGLPEGYVSVTVTDGNGCTKDDSIYVSSLTVAVTLGDVQCSGGNDGFVKLTVTGGTAPYTYTWASGQTTDSIGGLVAGNYRVTVQDAAANAFEGSYMITNPSELLLTLTATNASSGSNNGTASAMVMGGTAPYAYLWSTGSSDADITQQPAGDYMLTITDANGCEKTETVTIGLNTGVANLDNATEISLYPNPFGNVLHVVTAGFNQDATVTLYNYLGQQVPVELITHDASGISINTQKLAPGIYLLVLTQGETITVKRVVKGE